MRGSKISAICFDMWGTLCGGGGQTQWDDLQKILHVQSIDKKIFLKQGEESLLIHPWTLKEGMRDLAKKLDLKVTEKIIEKAFKSWWGYVQRAKPYPEVKDVLDKFKQLKIRKFIISNTDVEAFNFKIKTLGWNKYFEKFFLSGEIEVLKPDRKIFETVQDYLKIPKEQILMVDDSLPHGVYPARDFGWKALWAERGKEEKDKGRIESLKGVVNYITNTYG